MKRRMAVTSDRRIRGIGARGSDAARGRGEDGAGKWRRIARVARADGIDAGVGPIFADLAGGAGMETIRLEGDAKSWYTSGTTHRPSVSGQILVKNKILKGWTIEVLFGQQNIVRVATTRLR